MAVWQFLLMMSPVAVGVGCAVWLWGKDDAYRCEEITRLNDKIRRMMSET